MDLIKFLLYQVKIKQFKFKYYKSIIYDFIQELEQGIIIEKWDTNLMVHICLKYLYFVNKYYSFQNKKKDTKTLYFLDF